MPIKRKINQYKIKNGNEIELIATYDSIKLASETTKIHRNSISASLTGRHATAGGFAWKYEDDTNPIIRLPQDRCDVIAQVEPSTNMICEIYPSINEASRQTGISATTISSCLRGKFKTAGKWNWIYIKDVDHNQSLSYVYKNSPFVPEIYKNFGVFLGHTGCAYILADL